MKRITLFSVVAVLLLTGTSSADLIVSEFVSGENVTLDEGSGNYWYWNHADFVNMTYGQQITAINLLGTYGGIAGGWHLATLPEMEVLWTNSQTDIMAAFGSGSPSVTGLDFYSISRYELQKVGEGSHSVAGGNTVPWLPLIFISRFDTDVYPYLGAWVVSDHAVIPLPSSLILAATGLLPSMLGLNRWRRKH